MPEQRFPIGDGREVILSWRFFSDVVNVRVDGKHVDEARMGELRKCVLFKDSDETEIHVVAVDGVPRFPMFDVYYASRLLPGSIGDPRWARRNVIELLGLIGIYDAGA